MILLILLDKQLEGMLAAPNASTKAAAATGRLRMAAVVREAEHKALERLKGQIFDLLLSEPPSSGEDCPAGDDAWMDNKACLGDVMWEPPEEELHPQASDDSEEDGSDEDVSEADVSDEEHEDSQDEDEDEAEEEKGRDEVEASTSQDQAPETSDRKRRRGSGADVPSADEAALLSTSVLPATEKRGRRSSTVSLRTGDPVRKRLKF